MRVGRMPVVAGVLAGALCAAPLRAEPAGENAVPAPARDAAEAPGAEPARSLLEPTALVEFEALPAARQRIVRAALDVAAQHAALGYSTRSADPAEGGFDGAGAILYVLREAGLEPPRSASGQYAWLVAADRFVAVPSGTNALDDDALRGLRPGDLLLWSGTDTLADARGQQVTDVQIFLGHERSDGRPVMIGAGAGRHYREVAHDGYGVADFTLPPPGSRRVFVGYGTPPGVDAGP